MATILPHDTTAFTTAGEKRFYAFLRDALKPDSHCLAWYSPKVDDLEPDFVVYTPEVGLVVFEVKDWLLEQIYDADQRSFGLRLPGGTEERRTNPLQQAREYMFALLNRIKQACPQLLTKEARYQGKAKVPIEHAVVFSNITREAFMAQNLDKVLPAQKVLFADDITHALATAGNPHGTSQVREMLANKLPPLFPFQLTENEVGGLRELLWPKVRIILPQRSGTAAANPAEEEIRRLDLQQEALARRLDAPKAVVYGPAGCGKTLVLVHKAIQTLENLRKKGNTQPVLLVCFNITLVHYLKRLLAAHKAPLGKKGIQVMHFYEFCRSLLAEQLAYEKEETNYYKLVTQLALEASANTNQFGAVFVDEGQDFSDDMLQVLRNVCAPEGLFWVARDTAQELYKTQQHWLEEKGWQRFALTLPYRATPELARFCELLAEQAGLRPVEQEGPARSTAPAGQKSNAIAFHKATTLEDATQRIAQRIMALHQQGVPYSEMLVLYTMSKDSSLPTGTVPEFIRDALEEKGILVNWVAENAQTKTAWDITTDSVSLSTIHSMKGLDAQAVFVWGLDAISRRPEQLAQAQTLAYVACTRARHTLEILYADDTELITHMQRIAGRK